MKNQGRSSSFSKNSTRDQVWLGFDIKTEKGPVLNPQQIHFWNEAQFKKAQPEQPFHYHADALVGLSLIHLNPQLQHPFVSPKMNYSFCAEAWNAMEPHFELFNKSQAAVNNIRSHLKPESQTVLESFERQFSDNLESSMHGWGIDLQNIAQLIESIDYLESKTNKPMAYNFSIQFSKTTVQKMQYLYSLLFNTRAMIAMDYNAQTQDASHDACKMDSIADYLKKADYVVNDALLYCAFKKQKGHMNSDVAKYMQSHFNKLAHNGVCLIEALPSNFFKDSNNEELEEALYLVQMDWLLGTEAGLLYRLREELYGLRDGYENIFWPETQGMATKQSTNLSVSCSLDIATIYPHSDAA